MTVGPQTPVIILLPEPSHMPRKSTNHSDRSNSNYLSSKVNAQKYVCMDDMLRHACIGGGMGWNASALRIMGDEMALHNDAVVVIPDIYNMHQPLHSSSSSIDNSDSDCSDIDWKEVANTPNSTLYKGILENVISLIDYYKCVLKHEHVALCGYGYGGSRALEIGALLGAGVMTGKLGSSELVSKLSNMTQFCRALHDEEEKRNCDGDAESEEGERM